MGAPRGRRSLLACYESLAPGAPGALLTLIMMGVVFGFHMMLDTGAHSPPPPTLCQSIAAHIAVQHFLPCWLIVLFLPLLLRVSKRVGAGGAHPTRTHSSLYERHRIDTLRQLWSCPPWLLVFWILQYLLAAYFTHGHLLLCSLWPRHREPLEHVCDTGLGPGSRVVTTPSFTVRWHNSSDFAADKRCTPPYFSSTDLSFPHGSSSNRPRPPGT